MKCRFGYVSNSSSSSFLVCCNDRGVFDWLKGEDGVDKSYYDCFKNDMENAENQSDKKILEFLKNKFYSILYEYEWYLENKDKRWYYREEMNPVLDFVSVCHKMHNDSDVVNKIVKLAVELAKKQVEENGYVSSDEVMDGYADQFAQLLLDEGKKHWKHISTFGYEDDCGDFGGFMEHNFMGLVLHGEQESGGDYAALMIDEH